MKIQHFIALVVLSLATFPGAQAATRTWTGADPSGYWSAPANWSPAGLPTDGNDLVFPNGLPPGDKVSTNDLTDRIFRSISLAGGHTIRGNPITLTNDTSVISNSGTNEIACDWTFTAIPSPSAPYYAWPRIGFLDYPSELTVSGNVGGGYLNVGGGRLVMRGQFPGGRMYAYGGIQAFYGDFPHALSATNVGGMFLVQGSQPNLNLTMPWEMESASCPSLSGDGMVGDVTGCGRITPDSTLSVKSVSVYSLIIRLNGTNVGEYGRLVASGNVSLSTGSLVPSAGFHPQAGQVYTIVEKTSPGVIANEFLGPEGTVTTLNGMPFRISYIGGDGNDVTLTAQPTNTAPIVTWLQPANNAAFPPGFAISLRARATDSDGTVSFVDFFATPTNGPPINVGRETLAASDGFYIREWTNPPPGQYQLHAEAVDNAGGRGISDSVQIVVIGTNQPTNSVAQTRTWTGADPSGYWSAPANWSPAGVLVNGDDLVFPGGLPPGDMVSTNDLTDRIFRSISFTQAGGHTVRGNPITLTNRADCIVNSGTNVIACDLTFSGTPSTPPTPQFGSFTIRGSFGSGELTLIGNVGGGSLIPAIRRLVIRGQFTGGSIRQWAGDLALYGDNPYAVAAEFKNGTLRVQGSQPNLNLTMLWEFESADCPDLSGDGVVGDITGCGHIILDSTLSVKNLGPGGIGFWRDLYIHLNGTNVGEYGRLVVSGEVSLSGGSLSASPGFNPQAGQIYTVVEKTSPGPITNAIFGPEGSLTILNGKPFRVSYVGGDGNDVTLTVESNTPPTVTITNPPSGAVFTAPASFSLAAGASDPDGSVSQVQFFVDSTSVGTDTVSPYSANVSNLAPGTYKLSAVATDNQNARATNSITVIVNARPSVLAGPITNAANAHVYYLLSSSTWTASEAEASRLGGHLVTINDAAENQWVLNTFFPLTGVPYAHLWIGLNDAANQGQFVWANGEPVTFTYWYPGEPSVGGEHYAAIRHPSDAPPTGSWNDLSDTFGLEHPTVPTFGVVEMPAPTPLPLAVTQPADQIMPGGSARLNGQANPSRSPTVAWFEWGTSLAYGNATPPRTVGSGNNYVGFSNVLVGLVSGTEYHFRALGSNAFGFTAGLDRTFTAVTPGPIVLSGIQRPFGTQFVFSYSADVGLSYAVDRSATLSNWTTIRTDTANTNPMTVTDTPATNRMNFYRVRRLPNP